MRAAIRYAVVAATTATLSAFLASTAITQTTFGQQEVDQSKYVAVAAPRGTTAHQLLILEQVSNARPCWNESGSNPVLIDPLLLNFDFSGICGRSTDSNGYSIRVNGEDLALRYSLRVLNRNGNLILVGAPSNRREAELQIAQANGYTQNFAKLNLNPGWRFTKRTFGGRVLGHVYLTFEGTLPTPAPTPSPGTTPTPSPRPTPSPSPAPTPTPAPTPAPTPPPAPSTSFRDISNDIYANEIRQAVQAGFVSGFAEDNTFRPQNPVTREQLVSLVLESLKLVPNANFTVPTQVTGNAFSDVQPTRWSAAKIQFARNNNIVSGYQDGTFRPTQPVTRAEMMVILRKAAEYARSLQERRPTLEPRQQARTFSDTSTHWANQTISLMSAYCGVASPVNETGTAFSPNSPALRNYAAAATLRMLNCVRNSPN